MSYLAGGQYVPSNKFNALSFGIAIVVAFFLAIGISRLYALISLVNPIIYLNFLVLAGAVILLVFLTMLVKMVAKSRNSFLNITACIFICLTAWLANWAHMAREEFGGSFWSYLANVPGVLEFAVNVSASKEMAIGRLGGSSSSVHPAIMFICYVVECGAFFAPVYVLTKSKDYYCEDCDNSYATTTGYIANDTILHDHPVELLKGDLSFLTDTLIYKSLDTLPLDPKQKPGIGVIEFHHCGKCRTNSIVNINSGVLKYNDKEKREIGDVNDLYKDTYITSESNKLLTSKLGL